MMQFDIAGLIPMLTDVANGLPPEIGQNLLEGMNMMTPMFGPILAQLGPEIYVVTSYQRPFSADSQRMLVGIGAKDTAVLSGALTQVLSMMSMQARDFQGSQIWQAPANAPGMMGGMMGEMALGVGAGHMFVGDVTSVENALRQAGAADAPSFADDERFAKASSVIRNTGLSFSYTDISTMIEYSNWVRDNLDTVIDQQLADVPPGQQEFVREMLEGQFSFYESLPDFGIIARHLGDTITETHFTDGGIVMRQVTLRPADN